MTLSEAYQYGKLKLSQAGILDSDLDAWLLLEHVTGIMRAAYYADPAKEITITEQETYFQYIKRRAKRIPLQHITGVQEFMGLDFVVNEHVLIPRQDTECLVEAAEGVLQKRMQDVPDKIKLLDMCTGSGCILISLMKRLKLSDAAGADISAEALKIAERNANIHGVRPELIESDLFAKIEGAYDVIVSNPPYIRTEVIEKLETEVEQYDPFIALDGKEDGLYFYRKIIRESPEHLKNGGWLIMEIGFDQGEEVKQLMQAKGFIDITIVTDLSGLDRVVRGSVQ